MPEMMEIDDDISVNLEKFVYKGSQSECKKKMGVLYAPDLLKYPESLREEIIRSSPCIEVRKSKSKPAEIKLGVSSIHDELCRNVRSHSLRIIRQGRKSIIDAKLNLDQSIITTPQRRHSKLKLKNEEPLPKDFDVDQLETLSQMRSVYECQFKRLSYLEGEWEQVLREEKGKIPELAEGLIHSSIGKCQLLLSNKFKCFKNLLEIAERQKEEQIILNENEKPVLFADLLGYFETIVREIHKIDKAFDPLRIWRDRHDWDVNYVPISGTPKTISPVKRSVPSTQSRLQSSKKKSRFAKFLQERMSSAQVSKT